MATLRQRVRLWYAQAMQKSFKDLPNFATEDEERAFWATHDSTDYIDWSKAVAVKFPNLKRTLNPPRRKQMGLD
jgi:hypothetical protein